MSSPERRGFELKKKLGFERVEHRLNAGRLNA